MASWGGTTGRDTGSMKQPLLHMIHPADGEVSSRSASHSSSSSSGNHTSAAIVAAAAVGLEPPPPSLPRVSVAPPPSSATAAVQSWTLASAALAVLLVAGTTASELMGQHVNNAIPDYYFAVSLFSPVAGLLVYPILVLLSRCMGWVPDGEGLTWANLWPTLRAVTWVATCFALTNLLTSFGQSGRKSGEPDVATVLALVLKKLVVPVSLVEEAVYDRTWPVAGQYLGVAVLLVGIIVSALSYDDAAAGGHGPVHNLKVVCLIVSCVPLATGFLLVKRARALLPRVTAFELWMVLCLPEAVVSLGLTYAAQAIARKHVASTMSAALWDGLVCLVGGVSPPRAPSLPCVDAAVYNWLSLVPGFAFNLCIPVLIRLRGSTVVPLLRAVALPLAAVVAMTGVDATIATAFSWEGLAGVLIAFVGLCLYHTRVRWRAWPQRLRGMCRRRYSIPVE